MVTRTHIVVGIDFSPHSENALLQAARQACLRHAHIHVVHVIESRALSDLAKVFKTPQDKMETNSVREAKTRLTTLVHSVDMGDAPVEALVRVGDPFDEILRVVKKTGADLLVIGSKGTDASMGGAGSLASRCVRKADVPVLIVRRAHTSPFTKVCAFVDFARDYHKVILDALRITRADQARLQICHVFLPPWKVLHYMSQTQMPSAEEKQHYRDEIVEKLQNILTAWPEEAKGLDVEYSLIESSEKVVGIDKFLEEAHADLVVIDTRGRKGIKAIFLLRTIAEHIMRTSPCSVLVVKNEGD